MANSHSNHDHKDGSSCSSGAKHDHPDHGHGHDHDHDHSHVPEVTQSNERKILISFFIIFGFMIVEAVGGWMSGSLALIADAGHMLVDATALLFAWLGAWFARKPADALPEFELAQSVWHEAFGEEHPHTKVASDYVQLCSNRSNEK